VTIVGVAARQFTGLGDQPPTLWAPFGSYAALYRGTPIARTSLVNVDVAGRIPRGQTRDQAEAALGAVAAAAATTADTGLARTTGVRLDPAGSRFQGPDGSMMAVAVVIIVILLGLVVLLACVNVANLQLASALARHREIGVRLALGARRGRIVRQLVTESLALGIAAGLLGLLVMVWLTPALASMVRVPQTMDLTPDARVYVFVSLISVMAGIASGLAPARHGTGGDLLTPLKGELPRAGSGRPGRLRSTLIGVQAAASLVLIVLAALLTRATVRATRVDIGFDANHLIAIAPDFTMENYDRARARAFWLAGLERVRALPGVQSASLALFPPYGGARAVTQVMHNSARYEVYSNDVLPDYFSTLGLRIVRGRTFTDGEVAAAARVVIVSETLARDFWPGQDPVGRSLQPFDGSNDLVIGVVSNAITFRLRDRSAAALYRPLASFHNARAVLRTAGPPEGRAPALRDALQALDPRLRLDVSLPGVGLQDQREEPRIMAGLSGGLAVLALALAIIGIYGVTSFVTGQRTREIGVRLAIGASRSAILRLLLRDSLKPVAIGISAGAVIALLAGQTLAGMLYGVGGRDPLAFGAAVSLLIVSAVIAVWIPARRAARVDPALVLRQA
jgi:predicted permease